MGRRYRLVIALALVGSSLSACSSETATPSPTLPPQARVSVQPDDPGLPYGIVAIDYHFHDAHPSRVLSTARAVTFTNAGTVRHNVTFPGFGYSRDMRVGGTLEIERLGEKLGGPGTYTFFCRYHESLGMTGTIIIG